MVAAGVAELAEHRLTDDWGYVVESVYCAMTYASAAASSTSVRA